MYVHVESETSRGIHHASEKLMRRSRQQGLARMQIAIVHIEAQILENLVTGIELDTFIRKSTRIDILRPSVYTCRLDHILPVDKKGSQLRKQVAIQECLPDGYLVVHHALRFQIWVLRREHVHLPYIRAPEAFRQRSLYHVSLERTYREAGLRNPLATEDAVMLITNPGVQAYLVK